MRTRFSGVGLTHNVGSEMYDLNLHRSPNGESSGKLRYLLSKKAGVDETLGKALYECYKRRLHDFLLDRCVPPLNHAHFYVAYGTPQGREVDEFLATLPERARREKGRRVRVVSEEIKFTFEDYIKEDKVVKGGIGVIQVYKIQDLESKVYVSTIVKTVHPSYLPRHRLEAQGAAVGQDHIYGFLRDCIELIPRPLSSTTSTTLHLALPLTSSNPSTSSDTSPPVAPFSSLPSADAPNSRSDPHAGFFKIPSESLFAPYLSATRGSRVCVVINSAGEGRVHNMTIRGEDGKSICAKKVQETSEFCLFAFEFSFFTLLSFPSNFC